MPIKPPKCKTCGAEEWRHICNASVRRDDMREIEQATKASTSKPKKTARGKTKED